MKIVENSDSRLVLKESALTSRIMGAGLVVVGIGLVGYGVAKQTFVPMGLIGLGVAVGGVLLALFAKSDDVVVDKVGRQLSITFKSLKNRDGNTKSCSFDDVLGVALSQEYETSMNNTGNGNSMGGGGISFGTGGVNMGGTQTNIHMYLAIQLRDGSTMTVANEQRSMGNMIGSTGGALPATGQLLADAIGVPFQQLGAMSPSQMVQTAVTQVASAIQQPSVVPVAPVLPLAPVAPAEPQAQIPAAPPAEPNTVDHIPPAQ